MASRLPGERPRAMILVTHDMRLAADVSDATVVTLYLLTSSNARLRPLLTRQLKPGARIVSHAFSMGREWPADAVEQFVSKSGDEVTLYLWKADGKIRP